MLGRTPLPIRADRRVPFVRRFAFVDLGDFTGGTFKMEVRLYPDSASALITLGTVTTDVQGVRFIYYGTDTVQNHILAARLGAIPTGLTLTTPVPLSVLKVRIDKANMVALPSPVELGDSIDLAWDLHVTPAGGDEDKYAGGVFTVEAGVTQ